MKRTERIQTEGQAVPRLEFQMFVRHWLWYKWLLSHCPNRNKLMTGLAGEKQVEAMLHLDLGNKIKKEIWKHGVGERVGWSGVGGSVPCCQLVRCHVVVSPLAQPTCQYFARTVLPRRSYQLHALPCSLKQIWPQYTNTSLQVTMRNVAIRSYRSQVEINNKTEKEVLFLESVVTYKSYFLCVCIFE